MSRSQACAAWTAAIFAVALVLVPLPARAFEVQEVTTPAGLTVWLVEDHSLPLISMRFSFKGGASHDAPDRQGLAMTLASMLDEGAGDLDSQGFQGAVAEEIASVSFGASHDYFYGALRVPSEGRARAFELLRLALQEPRFDEAALERMRIALIQNLQQNLQEPRFVATASWMSLAFGDDPYGRLAEGTFEGLAAITPDDLRDFAARQLTRDVLDIVVVGDIDGAELAQLVDATFGGLPAHSNLEDPGPATVTEGPIATVIDVDIPQSYIIFGHDGVAADHPDIYPLTVMMHILGGGVLTSRLETEVRIKRGLTYGIGFFAETFRRAGMLFGETSTQNARAGETVAIIEHEIARMAEEGPTEAELDDAKRYLTGAYALRFGTGLDTALELLYVKADGRGPDFVNRRNALVEAVTLEDVQRVAFEQLQPGKLLFAVVGRPEGLTLPVRAEPTARVTFVAGAQIDRAPAPCPGGSLLAGTVALGAAAATSERLPDLALLSGRAAPPDGAARADPCADAPDTGQ